MSERHRAEDPADVTPVDPTPLGARVGVRAARRGERSDPLLELRQSLSWLVPFSVLVLAIVAVPLRILADEGLPRYRALRTEQADLDAQNERLRREVRDLQREVEALRSDPGTIERIARDELGMVRPGEVIFQFPD